MNRIVCLAVLTLFAGAAALAEPTVDGVFHPSEYSFVVVPTYDVIEDGLPYYTGFHGGTLAWELAAAPGLISIRGEQVSVAAGDVYVAFSHPVSLVDNAYGDQGRAYGWNNHKFQHLRTSDNARFAFEDAADTLVLDMSLDYLSLLGKKKKPLGYEPLGLDGDGELFIGSATYLVGYSTSLDYNLNILAPDWAAYTVNSPAPDDPIHDDWVYSVTYEMLISADAFGPLGFGGVDVVAAHISPFKEVVQTTTVVPEPGSVLLLGTIVLGMVGFNVRKKR